MFILALSILVIFALALTIRAIRVRLARGEEVGIEDGILLIIEVPKFNEQGPVAAEMMFATLHGLLGSGEGIHLSFEIVADHKGIRFFTFVPSSAEKFVKSQIYAQYPHAQISRFEDYTVRALGGEEQMVATEIALSRPYFFPLKTFPDFEVDPLAAITSAVEELAEGEQAWLQILVRPLEDIWQENGYDYANAIREGLLLVRPSVFAAILENVWVHLSSFFSQLLRSILYPSTSKLPPGMEEKPAFVQRPQLSAGQKLEVESIENKLTKLGFETAIRIVGIGPTLPSAARQVDSLVAALKQFSTAHLNAFERSEMVKSAGEVTSAYQGRVMPGEPDNVFVLNTEELASLFHLPNISVETPNIAWTKAKKSEPPLDLPVDVEPVIGRTAFREQHLRFGIQRQDRRRHMYIIGKTGTGKTTLLKNMIISDIRNGEGLAVLDPHGDLIVELLDFIPQERIEDVVVLDPSDLEHPVSINMLELFDPEQKSLVTSGLVEVFRRRFEFSWGPRLEHILRNCILSLLEIPNSTLLGVTRLLTDRAYEKYIVHLLEDPVMKEFWNTEYAQMRSNPRLVTEAIAPIQNRLGQFLSPPPIRNIVGQARSSIRLDEIMEEGKILLVNLAKGKIGEDNSAILGGMLISRLQFAAMTRAFVSEEERKDFFVYVDEFQSFATSSFAVLLSEARKYRLNLVLAHQYIAQLPLEVRDAIFGNVGTLITFIVGQQDAFVLAKELAPVFEENDLISLEKYHIYMKLMLNLSQSRPFSAETLPLRFEPTGLREKVIESSREKYASSRELVEERVRRWTAKEFTPGMDDKEVGELRKRIEEKAEKRRLKTGGKIEETQEEIKEVKNLPSESETQENDRKDEESRLVGPTPVTLKGEISLKSNKEQV